VPLKNTAYRVTFPIFDADGDLVSGAAGLDSERSLDGGAFSDCTNEAVEIGSSGIYYLDLTAAEMNGDTVVVLVETSTSGAKTTPIILYPAESADIPVNVKAISDDVTAADNLEADYDGTGYARSASSIGSVTAVGDKTGYALSAAGVDAVLDEAVEGALTLRQALRLFLAVLVGKSSGGGTTAPAFRDQADSKNRVSATVDANGNRTAVTLDAT